MTVAMQLLRQQNAGEQLHAVVMEPAVGLRCIVARVFQAIWEQIALYERARKVLHGGMNPPPPIPRTHMWNAATVEFATGQLVRAHAWTVLKAKVAIAWHAKKVEKLGQIVEVQENVNLSDLQHQH